MRANEHHGVADTLAIPLTARIYASKRFPDFFYDAAALALESRVAGTGIEDRSSEYSMIASVARYDNTDRMTRRFIDDHPGCAVVNLGCGLDTAFFRLGGPDCGATFYEVDLPEVINRRRPLLGESANDLPIAADLRDPAWPRLIDASGPVLMVASGVFQYFHDEEVLAVIRFAKERWPTADLIFDATTPRGLKYANAYVRRTGNTSAPMFFSIDDCAAFADRAGVRLVEQRPFYRRARRVLSGRVGPMTRIAMAVTDATRRAFLVHVRW